MKLFQPFKAIFLSVLFWLYASGAVVYVLAGWFKKDLGMGPEPRPAQILTLQLHSISGLLFLVFFGYLWATHIMPGWRRRRRVKTGILMAAICIALFISVPVLFYASNEGVKGAAVWIHTYLGLAFVLPFAAHLYSRPD